VRTQMLENQRALFAACGLYSPPSRDPDDEWVMVSKRAEWVEVTPPTALDPRHTQQT